VDRLVQWQDGGRLVTLAAADYQDTRSPGG